MRGVNKVILVGRLGKDPETKTFANGGSITNVSMATSESWKDKQGNQQEATEWHNLVFNDKLGEVAQKYLKKGSQCYVEGSIRTRKYQDKDGNDKYVTEIRVRDLQLLGEPGQGGGGQRSSAPATAPRQQASAPAAPAQKPFEDDDIPF